MVINHTWLISKEKFNSTDEFRAFWQTGIRKCKIINRISFFPTVRKVSGSLIKNNLFFPHFGQ